MSQLTLAAVVVAVLVDDGVALPLALGHGVADAVVSGVAVAAVVGVAVPEVAVAGESVVAEAVVGESVVAEAVVGESVVGESVVAEAVVGESVAGESVGEAVPEAAVAGDAAPPDPWWPPAPPGLAGTTYAAGEAQLAFAASATFAPEWSWTATMAPTTRANPTGMAIGTAKRSSGPLDRRPRDRCLLGIQSTSIS